MLKKGAFDVRKKDKDNLRRPMNRDELIRIAREESGIGVGIPCKVLNEVKEVKEKVRSAARYCII